MSRTCSKANRSSLAVVLLLLVALVPAVPSSAGPTPPAAAALPVPAAPAGPPAVATHAGEAVLADPVWVTTTVDSAGDVGRYTSLALDAFGLPHISYFAGTTGDLRYASFNGVSWVTETVDSAGDVGTDTSLALDAAGRPHISYYALNTMDLRYASFNGISWVTETVDSAGNVGQYSSLALDAAGRPRISYHHYYNFVDALRYAYFNGISWVTETVESAAGVGEYTSLALDTSGYPHISYHDDTAGSLKYASYNGTVWVTETLGTFWDGYHTSLALDASDYPHIAHFSSGSMATIHTYYDGTSWYSETVDMDGYENSLALDAAGFPHLAYPGWDGGTILKYAYKDGLGWHVTTVDAAGSAADNASLALGIGGTVYISAYDAAGGDLKIAVGRAGLTGVSLSGPRALLVDQPAVYTAVAQSLTVNLPITFTWSNGTVGSSAVYSWTLPGLNVVGVTATNGIDEVTASMAISVGVSIPISPGAGGWLYFTDTQGLTTTIDVPSGAVTQTVSLACFPLFTPTQPLSPGVGFAHHVFVLEVYAQAQHTAYLPLVWRGSASALGAGRPAGSGLPVAVFQAARLAGVGPGVDGFAFAAPITLTVFYSDADVAGLDENTLTFFYWTGSGWADAAGTCTPSSPYVRDVANNVLSVAVCHLTEFAMVGE
jgi:hypothetical protein